MDSGVTQTPKYLIKSRKQQATLRGSPDSGHRSVNWYQQALGQGPRFLVQYYRGQVSGEGNMPDRFSGKQFSDFRSELNLSSLDLTDSAVYLCASSQDTALHDQVPLGQKHPCPSSGSDGEVLAGSQPVPGFGRVDRFSQTFFLCCVLMLTKIMQDKYYFNCLYTWGELTCPGLILHYCQTRNQTQVCPQHLWSLPPLELFPHRTNICIHVLKE